MRHVTNTGIADLIRSTTKTSKQQVFGSESRQVNQNSRILCEFSVTFARNVRRMNMADLCSGLERKGVEGKLGGPDGKARYPLKWGQVYGVEKWAGNGTLSACSKFSLLSLPVGRFTGWEGGTVVWVLLCVYWCWTVDILFLNTIMSSGHYMYHQSNIPQFYVLPKQCIYVFCVDLRTKNDYFPIQH